jgi:Fur family peroxide stress response transcriptional regulator
MLKKLQQKGTLPGFKRTPQRLAILEYLDGNTEHPSAEEIYEAVSKKNPSLSFATVYNTLNTLVQTGAILEITLDPERRRYDPNTTLHNHAICIDCRRVMDIPATTPVSIPQHLTESFSVMCSHVEFYGECASCQQKKRTV